MDAVVCDVNEFHSINEQYGRHYGDLVLRSVGIGINKFARRVGGIGCRKTGDTFLLYCPHMDDYERLTQKIMADAFVDKEMADKVELRFGVFADARQEADIEERFARAQIAADSVEDDSGNVLGFYE
jgi:GGDEF domain-containing protein